MDDELERAVQREWFRAQGIGVNDAIHPADEMYLLTASMRTAQARRRAEYMRSGYESVLLLDHILATSGRGWGELDSLLEFACGFGRTTRFLAQRLDPSRLSCADVLPGSDDWVRAQFGVGSARCFPESAEPSFERPHDLIWVGSLFSHLPRERFETLLQQLFEALAPDGLLIFTTHGADKVPSMPKDPSGFTFHRQSESRTLDRDAYGSTFVSSQVLREIASSCGIEHLARADRHLWTIQDVWVASRAPLPEFAENAPIVRGRILRAEVNGSGHGWVGGFARVPACAGPIRKVTLSLAGSSAPAVLGPGQAQRSETSGEPETFLHHEWYLEGSVGGLAAGAYPLSAVAVAEEGPRICIEARELVVPPG